MYIKLLFQCFYLKFTYLALCAVRVGPGSFTTASQLLLGIGFMAIAPRLRRSATIQKSYRFFIFLIFRICKNNYF